MTDPPVCVPSPATASRAATAVAVPEDDVRFVRVGMPVRVQLDAFPLERSRARIERLHPRAELREHDCPRLGAQ